MTTVLDDIIPDGNLRGKFIQDLRNCINFKMLEKPIVIVGGGGNGKSFVTSMLKNLYSNIFIPEKCERRSPDGKRIIIVESASFYPDGKRTIIKPVGSYGEFLKINKDFNTIFETNCLPKNVTDAKYSIYNFDTTFMNNPTEPNHRQLINFTDEMFTEECNKLKLVLEPIQI